MKLSAHQLKVVLQLRKTDGQMVHWPGGFWTFNGCQATGQTAVHGTAYSIPDWWVGIQTIRALERLGLLQRLNTFGEEWRDSRIMTELAKTMDMRTVTRDDD